MLRFRELPRNTENLDFKVQVRVTPALRDKNELIKLADAFLDKFGI